MVTIPHTRSSEGFTVSFDIPEGRVSLLRRLMYWIGPPLVPVHVQFEELKLCADCRDALAEEISNLFGQGSVIRVGDPDDVDELWFAELQIDNHQFKSGGMQEFIQLIEDQVEFCETSHEGYFDDPL